jgi:flagellar protein FliS
MSQPNSDNSTFTPPINLAADLPGAQPRDLITPYLRAKIMSARPEELRMLLLDGAVRFARQAQEGLATKNFEQSYTGITKCRDIVVELMTSIKEEHNPELAKNVKGLYGYIFTELTEANLARSAERMGKIVELLEYERETWAMLMEKFAAERSAAPSQGAAAEDGPRRISLSA